MNIIYLDYASTTPMLAEAADAMRPWLTGAPGNPASAHAAGRRARRALEDAREHVAELLGAIPDEVLFTSGATEANNLAIFGLCGDPPGHLLAAPIEHPCVIEPLNELARRGFELEWLTVDATGRVDPEEIARRRRPDTRLVALMSVNHETGTIQPISECARELDDAGVSFHCDAAQAVGKIPVHFRQWAVTSLSAGGHKFGGPPGIGVLLLKRSTPLRPLFFGGHQQQSRRPGTESVALAVGFVEALRIAEKNRLAATEHVTRLRERFLNGISRAAPIAVNGPEAGGVPHLVNVSFPGCRADSLLMNLDLAGIACSTGSACSSGSLLPSPVLRAMRVADDRLHSAMRFSLGPALSEPEIDDAATRIVEVVRRLRE